MKNTALVFIIAGIASPCWADIYKCVGTGGEVAYRDWPCEPELRSEKLLQEKHAIAADSAAEANHETMAHLNGALEIYKKTRDESRQETAAARAAGSKPVLESTLYEDSSAGVADPVIYYRGSPYRHSYQHTHHHKHRQIEASAQPYQVDKRDPNWVLQTPDNSYQARQRANMGADPSQRGHANNADDEGTR